ncbi:hypothetical protein ANO11243_021940 [Dothideomycetidae sp. 11243]|nr:hypothetical protein ANO11243_021940 [fungal sp. No.11243]
MQKFLGTLAALAAFPLVFGQTYTTCNPTTASCSPDEGLDASSFSSDFTTGSSALQGWTLASGTTLNYGTNGAEFTISKDGQAPTIETDFHIFFGTVEVTMQAAPGVGIVSSIVFESSDLDEVDWEIIGSDTTQAQSDYFGKGNTTTYDRAVYQTVASPQTEFHTYKFDWSAERIIWSIDGVAVRTLAYADANGGSNFPQTPMRLKLGNWAGGCTGCPAGTAEWAGGYTDYSAGPFTMYVKSVSITNANPAKDYVWGDRSGSWQSIQVINSAANKVGTDSNSAPTTNVTSVASTSTTASHSSSVHSASSTMATSTKSKTASTSLSTTVATSTASSSGSRSNSTISGTSSSSTASSSASASPVQQTSAGTSTTPAAASLVLILTMILCVWMM